MAYDKFNILTSSAVPLPIENVDTDQIIPARFLKATNVKVLATTFSETGDTTETILPKLISF